MSRCKKCEKEFKSNWHLQRHLSKKISCKKYIPNGTVDIPNGTVDIPNGTVDIPNGTVDIPNGTVDNKNSLTCKYCLQVYSTKTNFNKHSKICKEKDDHVRCLELKLGITYTKLAVNFCRFCNTSLSYKTALTRHIKTCKAKQAYREKLEAQLEAKLKESTIQPQHPINQTINNNQTINVLNVSAETLRKFGEEPTDHITNAYLRKVIGRLGVPLPKVVSTVAKQIYCDNNNKENQTIQITNVRSQWAKVSNGKDYELQPLTDSVKGVRNKVTDLYIERQCDEPEYFKKVNSRIDRLDDLNNQNYTAKTLEDKEDQKNASKLASEIDREIKSMLYNLQKSGDSILKFK